MTVHAQHPHMNLFFLSWSLATAARLNCDQHVNKIPKEAVQMLWTAHRMLNPEGVPVVLPGTELTPFRMSHSKHPMSVWVRSARSHYELTVQFAQALVASARARFKPTARYRTQDHLDWLANHVPAALAHGKPLEFDEHGVPVLEEMPPLCMPDRYKIGGVVESTRAYYIGEKAAFARYGHPKVAPRPSWLDASEPSPDPPSEYSSYSEDHGPERVQRRRE